MSVETLTRIMDETSARLATASDCDEIRAIGLEHVTKTGADLAEALFTHVSLEPFSDAEINTAILRSFEGLQQSVIASFEAMGITEDPYLELYLEASTGGFLDRCEALFSLRLKGGAA